MSTINLNLLLDLSQITNEQDQNLYIFQNPVLLSENFEPTVKDQIATFPKNEQARLAELLKYLQSCLAYFENRILEYPIGLGPIESIMARWENGEINGDEAEKLVQEQRVTSLLSRIYIKALSVFALNAAHEGKWRSAVNLHRLLAAAVQATPHSTESKLMRWRVDFDWVEIANIALVNIPDGRIYRSAMKAGKRAAEEARKKGDYETQGEVLHRLGALNGDPFCAGRLTVNYPMQMRQWHQRLLDELGPEAAFIPPAELKMPSPEDALKLAENFYRQAVALSKGEQKGLSLKALAETLEWEMRVFNVNIDQKELGQVCQDALTYLDPESRPEVRLDVLACLSRLNYPLNQEEVEKTLRTSPDQRIRMIGPDRTLFLVVKASEFLENINPLQSLSLLKDSRSLFEQYGKEKDKVGRWVRELCLIDQAMSTNVPTSLPAGGLQTVVDEILQRSKNENWDAQKQSASLIALASKASNWNEEASGLRILDEARRIAPVFTKDYADALDFLAAELNLNLGANGVASGDYATAIDAYARALRQFLNMGLEEAATNCLVRIDDLASRQGPDIGREVVRGLAPLIQALENKLGEPAERLIQHTCKQALAGMGQKKVNPEVPFFLFQIAKGLRFAKALYAGSRYRWREDARGEALLQQIQKARSELPANSPILIPPNPEALLGENSLLTSYSSTSVGKYGSEAEERLVNLQQTYDRYLYQRLLASTESEEVLYFSSRDIQSAIDERTVLLDYYIGATPNGTVGLSLIVLTRDDYRISVISYNDVPDMTVFMGDSQTKVEVNPLALRVEELRNEIQKDPGKDLVTQEAAKTLEFNLIGYLGPFIEYLDQLNKQGKDHLLIIPHGPLHYFPFHLLGKPGKPLADNWKITYLPNLHLLTSSRGAPAVRRFRERTITAFGLSFVTNNPFKLKPPLPEATEESKAIAGVFGAEPLNEDDATETNFVNSLKNSRFVHLATHGRQNVNAPAFHCVFLSPDAQSDGVLYAHELLSQDLRGLEVLTLSACETALGRFDAGDNLRGLPASFLLAGVSTLIGTLWSVETCCAEYFFEKLYRELKNGASRLDAFAVAQSETRKAFPQYRDWGAFYFIGDWI